MPTRQYFKFFGNYALSIYFLFMSFGYTYYCFKLFKEAQNSIKWTTTTGVIVFGTEVNKVDDYSRNIDKKKYYRYKVNNKIYYSDRISFSPFFIQKNNIFKLNEKIKIYYDPKNQKSSTVETKVYSLQFFIALFIPIFVIIIALYLIVRVSKHDIRIKPTLSEKQKIKLIRVIDHYFILCIITLFIEILPINIALLFSINTKIEGYEWASLLRILIIFFLVFQTGVAFSLTSDSASKYKKNKTFGAHHYIIMTRAVSLTVASIIPLIIWILYIWGTV